MQACKPLHFLYKCSFGSNVCTKNSLLFVMYSNCLAVWALVSGVIANKSYILHLSLHSSCLFAVVLTVHFFANMIYLSIPVIPL